MATSKVTSKGQITIPKAVRSRLNLNSGDSVEFRIENDQVHLVPLSGSLSDVFGILSRPDQKTSAVEAMNKGIRESIGAKFR